MRELEENCESAIFVRWVDMDGTERFTLYEGKRPDMEIGRIRARKLPNYGGVIVVDVKDSMTL